MSTTSRLPTPEYRPETEERAFWDALAHGELVIQRCTSCRRFVHPPRAACPTCMATNLSFEEACGLGIVHSLTRNHRPPGAYRDVDSYLLAAVRLDEGPLVFTNLVGPGSDDADVGTRVRAVVDGSQDARVLRFRVELDLVTNTQGTTQRDSREGEPDPAPGGGRGTTLAPLTVAHYRRVIGAALVGHVGTFLHLTAAPWLMLEFTGSPFLVSLVTASMMAPRVVLARPSGALADVLDRRLILIVGNAISAVAVGAMALLAWTDTLGATSILALTLAVGVGSAMVTPAFHTLAPDLVPRPLLPQAVALNSGAFAMARAIGPALGGLLIAADAFSAAFALDALSFLIIIVVLLTLPAAEVPGAAGAPRSVVRATIAGVRFAAFSPALRRLLLVATAFTLTAACVQTLLAPAAAEMGMSGRGFGLLMGSFGMGALVGVLTRETLRRRLGRLMVPASIGTFGMAGILFGLVRVPSISIAVLCVSGASWVWVVTTFNATLQLMAPEWVRSRVTSLYTIVMGLQLVGAMLSGLLADLIGTGLAISISTAGTLVVGLLSLGLDGPTLDHLEEPRSAGLDTKTDLRDVVAAGRVLVIRTWQVSDQDVERFLSLSRLVRDVRRRSGARSWELRRDAMDCRQFLELVSYVDWQEHLLQRTRLQVADHAVLKEMWSLDQRGAPATSYWL